MWMYSPSANHSWWTPREVGPERSKNAIRFGFSGVEMSNSSNAGLRVAGLLRLIGDRQDVADRLQRIGAHAVVRQIGARDDLQRLRVGDVDRGVVLRRALMRHPQDAPAVLGELHRHALAHAAEPVERMVRELPEIPDQRVAVPVVLCIVSLPFRRELLGLILGSAFDRDPPSYSGVPVISATARTAARAPARPPRRRCRRDHTDLPHPWPPILGHRPRRLAGESEIPTSQTGPTCWFASSAMIRPGKSIRAYPLRRRRHVDAIAHGAT